MGTDAHIETAAEKVHGALIGMRAFGRARARKQGEVAAHVGISTRMLQDATLLLNQQGVPVCSTCVNPAGVFIAETPRELEEYRDQLHSRLQGNGKRMACVNRMLRKMETESVIDSSGQRRLFA